MRAELFVAVLGASNYLYAEAFASQELLYWVTAHVHCFEALGGCPAIVVWDYVPRHIIAVLCPAVLCGQRWLAALVTGGDGLGAAAAGHIIITARRAS